MTESITPKQVSSEFVASDVVRPLTSAPGQPDRVGVRFRPTAEDGWTLPDVWEDVLEKARLGPTWSNLREYVDGQRQVGTVYPPVDQVFRAFELTSYDKVRVVILGQDPYHGPEQAHGLAFSVAHGPNPPSLRKILNELERDPKVSAPADGNLERWASQGVLLLNTVLTVGAGAPNSHQHRGWEQFTDAVIRAVNEKSERVVFLLWGGAARKKARLVTGPQHRVITAAHPAARANAKKQLVGSGVFSLANEALSRNTRVDWGKG